LALDHIVAVLLGPLACWVLLNGVDDLVIDIAALIAHFRQAWSSDPDERTPTEAELDAVPKQRLAIFVAAWREHRVIRRMLETNAANINYPNFDFFVGTYPNDPPTLAAVRETARLYPNLHHAVCPHDGPTSKADCLNWIYKRMLQFEEEHGVRFDMAIIHDAEDTIDPDALRWINYHGHSSDMVQIPILALKTPLREVWHGIYCDDFAESQFRDMPARQLLGGFLPSTGVGAGLSRRALETLAETSDGRVFEPAALTEDYEIGFRIRALGLRQKYVPIHIRHGRPIATREYFPQPFWHAVRQRCRWVMGIALQSWEFHTARETFEQLYWFWRDRKGLAGNLIAPFMNLLFLYGGATWAIAKITHQPWNLARETPQATELALVGLALQALHASIRTCCSARIYGWRFAATTTPRMFVANLLNAVATARAIRTYAAARLAGKNLKWAKTDHRYPAKAAADIRPIDEILVTLGSITEEELEAAWATKPAESEIGDHLLASGVITEEALYGALARHYGVLFGKPDADAISTPITRLVPAEMSRRWRVLPFRIQGGELYLATTEIPPDEFVEQIRSFSSLDLRYHLVTQADFEDLASRYLPRPRNAALGSA
jgi:adsorption protein B